MTISKLGRYFHLGMGMIAWGSGSLLGTLGGILGGKLYILGVAGYDTPIWDVLALQGERKEAGEHLCGDR